MTWARSRTVCALVGSLVGSLVVTALLSGCSAGLPPTLGPGGVDGLTIPTPSPDPGDFVRGVDNPWFPLVPGTVWTYRVYGASGRAVERVRVLPRTSAVGGIATTGVEDRTSLPDGRVLSTVVRLYAQDRAGNVWWLGQRVSGAAAAARSWLAGEQGARAGLAMAATPRLGDGYVEVDAPGVLHLDAEVLAVDGTRTLTDTTYRNLVVLETTAPGESAGTREYYARGVGLVSRSAVTTTISQADLVSIQRP